MKSIALTLEPLAENFAKIRIVSTGTVLRPFSLAVAEKRDRL